MKTVTLLRNLAKFFPKRLKAPGDHVGLMTGRLKEKTERILLCLDFDDIVMKEVPAFGPDLILTHHPFIYGTRRAVLSSDPIKADLTRRIDELAIPVYSMHTNFDTGQGGMNDALMEALELLDVRPLSTCPMARGGLLKTPLPVRAFAAYVNEKLGLPYSHLIHAGKDVIKSAAIIGGGGARNYLNALEEGYDIFISGDIPHHVRRDIIARKYDFLDVAHEVERIFLKQMKKILLQIDPTLKIRIVDHEEVMELITPQEGAL